MVNLSQILQESLLVLLTYYDEQAKLIKTAVDPSYFEKGEFREIAVAIYSYIERYRAAPKDQLEDLFEDILTSEDQRDVKKAGRLRTVFQSIYDSKDKVDVKFAMDRLGRFVRHQEIKKATLEVAEIVTDGRISDENILKAEALFARALRKKIQLFDPGTFFGDSTRALSFLEDVEEKEQFLTGIWPLDDEGLGPKRQTLHLLVGLPKQGKSWWLINLGTRALQQGHKVCHISLEMGEKQLSRRYHQSYLGIANRNEDIRFTKFQNAATDGEEFRAGDLRSIRLSKRSPKHAYNDPDILNYLLRRRKRIEHRLNRLVIKAFPTGQLTLEGLKTHLDTLETHNKFIPDLLLIDYPRLMNIDSRNLRIELGSLVVALRGLAVERNMAVAAVSQSSRMGIRDAKGSGERYPVLTLDHIGEDFSQGMTADVVLTYNQTKIEREYGIARLHVVAARDEEGGFTVMISQRYQTGLFCYDAARMKPAAQKILSGFLDQSEEDEEEEE